MEMRLPNWVRVIILISTLMQLGFGLTLLVDPSHIADLWPWSLPPLTARLLGASTLVSTPLALLSIGINRYGVAMIPLVMMFTYRALQLVAGLIHLDRFAAGSMVTLNYFGGGLLMLVTFGYPLIAGSQGRLPPAKPGALFGTQRPWRPRPHVRDAIAFAGGAFLVLGLAFLVLGGDARPLWFDTEGLKPLTARLFASPLIGLGLGLSLVSRAKDSRAIMVPAVGMITIGVLATLSIALSFECFTPQSPLAWGVAGSPILLLVIGLALLFLRPSGPPHGKT
jgi:hypothetical protein